MVKDLYPYTKNNVYREIFEVVYDFSDAGNHELLAGPSGVIIYAILPNITFPQMYIANIWEGGLRLQSKTLNLALFSKRCITICIVMQLWLNRSMYVKAIMSNGGHEKLHL